MANLNLKITGNSLSRFDRKRYNQDRLFKFLKRSPVRKSNLAYFNKETKCNAKKCGYFSYKKNCIFGVNPDELVSRDLLIEKKSKAVGSAGTLKDLRKTQLQIVCTGSKYCITMSYHPESKSANYILVTLPKFLWNVIKVVVHSIYPKPLSKNGHTEKM